MVESKTYGTSDEAVSLMKTGEYDVVAASGDATLRLIAGGDVAPVNTDLIPSYAGIYDFLKDQAWNSVDGVSYGVPARLRRQPAAVQHGRRDPGADLVGRRVRQGRRLHRQGHRVRLADLHRGCRGVPDGAPARPRHREPVRPRRGAVPGRRRPAQGAAPAHQRVLVGLPQGDPGVRDRPTRSSARRGRSSRTCSRARARRPRSCCPKRARPAGRTPG